MGQPCNRDDGRTENVEGYTSDIQTPPQNDQGEWQRPQPPRSPSQNPGNGDDNSLSRNDDPAMSTDVVPENSELKKDGDAVFTRIKDINEHLEWLLENTEHLTQDLKDYKVIELVAGRLEEFDNKISTLTASISKRTEVEDEKTRIKVKELEDQMKKEREEFTEYRSGRKGSEVVNFIGSLIPVYDRWVDVINKIPGGYRIPRTAAKDALGNMESVFMSQGVETYQTSGPDRDRKLHDVVDETIPTDDRDKDGKIAIRYRKGFKTGDGPSERILRKEVIAVYEFNNDGGIPNDTE